ncbi:hypothetical protein BJ165DRAFT_768770 [Panaeolus papilionaceus]|nr:hypothetical protein BJ165DRAFT_768770 [Panaeolus papilionaceus]
MKQLRRHVRLLTYRDPTRRNAAEAIVKCMLSRPVDAKTYYNTQHVPPLPELQTYIESLDIATRGWVEEGSQRSIGTDSNRAASDARKEKPTATLYVCRWCRSTFTVKHNLATHVRAHLDLHVSFCNRCDYSSTSATIPARHRKACEAKPAKFII